MKNEKTENVYFTNMEQNDPIIEKFMNEYVEQITEKGKVPTSDDLIVNFEITYADGTNKSYTCGSESCVFGNTGDLDEERECNTEGNLSYREKECNTEGNLSYREKECNTERNLSCKAKECTDSECTDNECTDSEGTDSECDFSPFASFEFEEDKWDNCRDEWNEYLKGCNYYSNKENKKDKKEKKEVKEKGGEIEVYSILQGGENTKLKGVKINLYRINGLCPILIESKNTDENGKVVFSDVEDGNYRVIEFIDKTYFEKPSYIRWNEVKIDKLNKEATIYAVNTIKQNY